MREKPMRKMTDDRMFVMTQEQAKKIYRALEFASGHLVTQVAVDLANMRQFYPKIGDKTDLPEYYLEGLRALVDSEWLMRSANTDTPPKRESIWHRELDKFVLAAAVVFALGAVVSRLIL